MYQILVYLILLFQGKHIFDLEFTRDDMFYLKNETSDPTDKVEMTAIIFQTFVFLQLFNQISSRTVMSSSHLCHVFTHFYNNWRFWAIWFSTLAAQLFIV